MKLEKGTLISHYQILSKIGKGGMGEVYLAEDTKLDRKAALKILPTEFAEDEDRMGRFVREAKSASTLNHPNIITIHEIGETDGTHYIATEFIDGKTLNEYAKDKQLNLESALEIAIQTASALDVAHSAGIVHRDIKPDNVMIRKDGLVKILDFGIAKLSEPTAVAGGIPGEAGTLGLGEEDKTLIAASPIPPIPASPKTSPGMIIGTANYMSPEQAKGHEIDARTDIFSLGVVLYEMISGHLPFEGEGAMETIGAIIHKEPKPLSDEAITPEIKKIIGKTLRKNRDERYQTMKGLLADLKDLKEELHFQNKLDKTVQPDRKESETQVFRATTFSDAPHTTEAGSTNDSISIKRSSAGKMLLGIGGILILAAAALGYWYFAISSEDKIESIAVMPFVNESGNESIEYLSDGMTETLIGSLSNIPDLSVKSRSTVFFYKGKEMSPKKLGEELDVQAVLLGRVTERGEDLNLNLELVNTSTQDVIWSRQYNRKTTDLVVLQGEIAQDVSSRLKTKFSGTEPTKLTKNYTSDPEAYRHYLQGRFYWNKRDAANLKKAIEQFKAAADRDPNFALAFVGLADSYAVSQWWSDSDAKEELTKASEYADRALKIDASLGEAYASRAYIDQYLWRWDKAEIGFKKAIEISPNYATAHKWYGEFLTTLGRNDEAVVQYQRALELEPLSVITNYNFGSHYCLFTNTPELAIPYAKRIEELDDRFGGGPHLRSFISFAQGRDSEAVEYAEKAVELTNGQVGWFRSQLGRIYAKTGQQAKARAMIAVMEKIYTEKRRNGYQIALIYEALGDKDKAFEWLEKDLDSRSGTLAYFINTFVSLKSDPRFADVKRRMGFPN